MFRLRRDRRGLGPRRGWGSACLVAGAALWLAGASAAVHTTPAEAVAAKGIIDANLEAQILTSDGVPAMVREIHGRLGAEWVVIHAAWSVLEPSRGAYDGDELERLDRLVAALHGAGVKLVMDVVSTPAWAQEKSLWPHPPAGMDSGPHPFYPVSSEDRKSFGRLAEFLARRYAGRVQALECWNEPNLWTYLYPQRTAGDPYYGARSYLRMLRAFRAGVDRSHVRIKVVAGVTAPVGLNDIYRTSPQRFARFLRRAGAARLFDVYSHHPYTPGGSVYPAPGQAPNDPTTTVTLYNLRTLLRLFPRKPFYLTEYGYCTRPAQSFGGFTVDEAAQARYLTQAYRLAGSYRQVKVLVWFLLRDQPGTGEPGTSISSGLRRLDGSRKPAWYAYRAL
jgi:polysaccharide biosynthesis protein PslG